MQTPDLIILCTYRYLAPPDLMAWSAIETATKKTPLSKFRIHTLFPSGSSNEEKSASTFQVCQKLLRCFKFFMKLEFKLFLPSPGSKSVDQLDRIWQKGQKHQLHI